MVNMNKQQSVQKTTEEGCVKDLIKELSDPIHKKLLQAYQGSEPVQSMEAELRNIITEVFRRED